MIPRLGRGSGYHRESYSQERNLGGTMYDKGWYRSPYKTTLTHKNKILEAQVNGSPVLTSKKDITLQDEKIRGWLLSESKFKPVTTLQGSKEKLKRSLATYKYKLTELITLPRIKNPMTTTGKFFKNLVIRPKYCVNSRSKPFVGKNIAKSVLRPNKATHKPCYNYSNMTKLSNKDFIDYVVIL